MDTRMFFLIPCALASLFLSGCAERWEKPNATDKDFQKIQAVCADQALLHFPPIIRQIEIQGARMNPIVTSCSGSGSTMRCGTSGGQYTPPLYAPLDDNQKARDQDIRNCYFDNGWHPVE